MPVVKPDVEQAQSVPYQMVVSGGSSLYLPEAILSKGFGYGLTKRFVSWNEQHVFSDVGIHIYHLSKPFYFSDGKPVFKQGGSLSVSSQYTGYLIHTPQRDTFLNMSLSAQASAQLHYRLAVFKIIPYHLTTGVQIEGPNTAFTNEASMFVSWTLGVSILMRSFTP